MSITGTGPASLGAVNVWYGYRDAWARRPWLAVIAGLAAAMLVVGLVATLFQNILLVLFIPGLLLLLGHHFYVQRLDDDGR